jgi:tetratricopeptide (TPR) repeat protein/tRNA A-37 threonylcarbamoyl transferase component Bud32
MTNERWQRVDELYHAALEREGTERAAFLETACKGDDALRREVESLLASDDDAGSFLAESAMSVAAGELAQSPAPSRVGARLGSYELLAPLGAGGMGEVYRARDLRLGRIVAIKILASHVADDPEFRRRFAREARTISQLSHPHICALYDVGQQAPSAGTGPVVDYLVLEYLDGETLADRLARGALPLSTALQVAVQIASALDTAHRAGIVHRDLKPGNVFLVRGASSGVTAKLLDFGVAKAPAVSTGETIASDLTATGMILGTVQYMAPEQLEGREADARTDIFSFGALLYEMFTGRKAFEGSSRASVMAGILERDPLPIATLQPEIPPLLTRIVDTCLAKNPDDRCQTMRDLLHELTWVRDGDVARTSPPDVDAGRSRRGIRGWVAASAIAAAIAAAAAGGFWYYAGRATAFAERDTIVVADFVNDTGDTVFDGTLKQAVSVKLEESPFVSVFPEERVRETLGMMERPVDTRVTGAIAREVCQRHGVKALVAGSIASLGSQYVVALEAMNCTSGEVIARAQAEASAKEGVLRTVGEATVTLRGRLGESLASIQTRNAPIEQATTSSLEAFKAFTIGNDLRFRVGGGGMPFYHRAVELDPDFAMAYVRLAVGYQGQQRRKYIQEAYNRRDRVTDYERAYITAQYHSFWGNVPKAIESFEIWKRTYPADSIAPNNLASLYWRIGAVDKSLASALEALRMDPNAFAPYTFVGPAYLALGRVDEAKAIIDQAIARTPGGAFPYVSRYKLAFLRGDTNGMEQALAGLKKKRPNAVSRLLAEVAAFSGRIAAAGELTETLVVRDRSTAPEAIGTLLAGHATTLALVGWPEAARAAAAEALKISDSPNVALAAAHLYARIGPAATAQARIDRVAQETPPTDTLVHAVGIPLARALLESADGQAEKAIASLRAAEPYDTYDFNVLHARASAYLAAGRAVDAMNEYRKILDRGRWLLPREYPFAQLGLARAAAAAVDVAKSRQAYEEFFKLWKDADPDLPILIAAKQEYARLKS